MSADAHRVNVTLDAVYAAKLRVLAERTHLNEGTLARSLLSSALDDADPDARNVTELLGAIPGALERAQLGREQAVAGLGTPLDDLARLVGTHTLPPDTGARVARILRRLEEFPLLGAALEGRWEGFRFVLGPWRWMVVVYVFDEERDGVAVVTVQDARSSRSPSA